MTSKSINFDAMQLDSSVASSLTRRDWLRQALQQCRDLTLARLDTLDYETCCQQAHPEFSPVGWHLGHIAYTEALWILQHSAGRPPQFPEYQRLFAADGLPKGDRGRLPSLDTLRQYLDQVRAQTLDYLEVAPLEDQERLWRWLIQHESQHNETMALILALQQFTPPGPTNSSPKPVQAAMVEVPGGEWRQGDDWLDTMDNERSAHTSSLDTYWIDRFPVTCSQYQHFIETGGYQDAQWWSAEGWQWLQANPVQQPLYWLEGSAYVNYPVCGVSWYEAEAYARFVGKRLPTEAEWEKAASWDLTHHRKRTYPWGNLPPTQRHCNHQGREGFLTPVDQYVSVGESAVNCCDMLGNVWEWTDSWFTPYPNFQAYPYPGYSQAYFDGQHRVLRGGSWATFSWALRNTFRNWYYPDTRQIFAGFRCASSQPIP